MKMLCEIELYKCVRICKIKHECTVKQRLHELGFVKNSKIIPVLHPPFTEIRAYKVKGSKVALHNDDATCIFVEEDSCDFSKIASNQ